MGIWDSICSFASSACSAIASVASSIGKGVAHVATSIASLGVSLAAKVGDAIKEVAIFLGILKVEDKMEELGEKAMQSDKNPEDFDSMNEYIEHLRNDVILDTEKFDKLDKSELLARASIGASITLKGIEEKLETVISPEFMVEVAKQELDANKIVATIKAYKENDLNLDEYSLYLNDELTINNSDKHADALVSAYQKLEPEMTIEQIEDQVMNLKASS